MAEDKLYRPGADSMDRLGEAVNRCMQSSLTSRRGDYDCYFVARIVDRAVRSDRGSDRDAPADPNRDRAGWNITVSGVVVQGCFGVVAGVAGDIGTGNRRWKGRRVLGLERDSVGW